MHKTITRGLTMVYLLVLMSGTGTALAQSEKQIEQFNQERIIYFNERLELTEAETEAFWPLYNDFHNRKMKIAEDIKNTFRYCHQNETNLSEEEVVATLKMIGLLKGEMYELETDYYQTRFPEILPPGKMLKLYNAEREFRGHLIRKIRGHGPGGPEGEGPQDGRGRGRYNQFPAPGV